MANVEGSKHWTMVAWLIVFALAAFVLLKSGSTGVEGERAGPRGVPVPDLALTDFEGRPFRLSDYRGTPVVVNFWASWCAFCLAEMPDFESVYQSLENKVEFVGIAQRDDFEAAKNLAQQTGVTYRLVRDPQGRAYDAIARGAMPTTAFIDKEGNVVEVVGGMLTEGQLRELIVQHFGVSA